MESLTGKQKHHLRALAHHLQPLVLVGHEGVSPGLVQAVDEALESHELIKVRFGETAPVAVDEGGPTLALAARAHLAQTIGRIAVLYRRRKDGPTIRLPR